MEVQRQVPMVHVPLPLQSVDVLQFKHKPVDAWHWLAPQAPGSALHAGAKTPPSGAERHTYPLRHPVVCPGTLQPV